MKINYTVIGLLIVLSPLIILAIHYRNRLNDQASKEAFAASQGGALIQLMTSHVASEEEVARNLEQNKRQVVHDIINLTEPESIPGPQPAIQYNRV